MCSSISVRILFRLAADGFDLVDLAHHQRFVGVDLDQPRQLRFLPVELLLALAQLRKTVAEDLSIRADWSADKPQFPDDSCVFPPRETRSAQRPERPAPVTRTTASARPSKFGLMRKPLKETVTSRKYDRMRPNYLVAQSGWL